MSHLRRHEVPLRKRDAERSYGAQLFAVDEWACSKSKVFFLTHMHADHIKGLSQQWRRGPIYCSSITAALFNLKFPNLDIRVLPLDTPTLITLPSRDLLEVTAIDANHCPGSVMLVFRGDFGCIVHTGDFRWEHGSPKLKMMMKSLASAVGGHRVDLVHLDNTFCNPAFYFPARHVAAQQMVEIITQHEGFDILIAIDMLGKEELLIFIAQQLNTKIRVSPERMLIMEVLGIAEYFTTDTSITKIRAVPRYSVSHKTLSMLNEIRPTVAVVPSGLNSFCKMMSSSPTFSSNIHGKPEIKVALGSPKGSSDIACLEGNNCEMNQIGEKCIHYVPYSLHSCFNELQQFVSFIKPLSVKGNLNFLHLCVSALSDKQVIHRSEAKHPADKGSFPPNEYLDIISRDTASSGRNIHYNKKIKRSDLRRAVYNRSLRSWALLRARRAGGTFLCSDD
ncbi:hypothetical protein KP509_17G043700 [Ceratopteris richardii]|uniref:Protein artemis n=1 Tax=Ceratopteris richardii TaxID=49495 RepID=A0A8T2SXS1_CERRI|nr:hypothetical protein KP509_17G043700 [Ceratopteris richardii]